jgi:hypothetical protein
MYNLIISLIILTSNSLQDPSGYWIPSIMSSKYDLSFKSKYISKVGSKITIWLKLDYNLPSEEKDKIVKYKLLLEECDCNNLSTKSLSIVEYDENDELLNRFNYKEPELSYAVPGSNAYRYITDICNKFNKKKKK